MSTSRAASPRRSHADWMMLLDRAAAEAPGLAAFAEAALDTLRLAMRPAWVGLALRDSEDLFLLGDEALAEVLQEMLALTTGAPRGPKQSGGGPWWTPNDSPPAMEACLRKGGLQAACRIARGERDHGLLVLGPRARRAAYREEDRELCELVAARLALVASEQAASAEARRLREALAAAEVLAAVGRMAAGLAHEIRNPLVSIRTFTQLLPERHQDEEFRSSFHDLTLSEIDRITSLVGELLSHARPATASAGLEAPSTDASECVEGTCLLMRSSARAAGVQLLFDGAELPERAAIAEDKLRQVVLNLVGNAIQACEGRGSVRVRTLAGNTGRIVVEVADDGPGMEPHVAARIFEPFFTTRREGTGLGLALVHELVTGAGGTVQVATSPGSGTTFRVELLRETEARLGPTCDAAEAFA